MNIAELRKLTGHTPTPEDMEPGSAPIPGPDSLHEAAVELGEMLRPAVVELPAEVRAIAEAVARETAEPEYIQPLGGVTDDARTWWEYRRGPRSVFVRSKPSEPYTLIVEGLVEGWHTVPAECEKEMPGLRPNELAFDLRKAGGALALLVGDGSAYFFERGAEKWTCEFDPPPVEPPPDIEPPPWREWIRADDEIAELVASLPVDDPLECAAVAGAVVRLADGPLTAEQLDAPDRWFSTLTDAATEAVLGMACHMAGALLEDVRTACGAGGPVEVVEDICRSRDELEGVRLLFAVGSDARTTLDEALAPLDELGESLVVGLGHMPVFEEPWMLRSATFQPDAWWNGGVTGELFDAQVEWGGDR